MNTRFVPALALSVVALTGCASATNTAGSTPSSTTKPVTTPASPSRTPSPIASRTTLRSTPRPVPACTTSSLRFSSGSAGAAAGNWYALIIVTNISRASCSLLGSPTVSYLDARGHRVGAQAVAEPGAVAAQLVILRPGERAAATLHQASPYNFAPGDCGIVRTAGYAVALPKGRTVDVPAAGATCSRAKSPTFWVEPFTKAFQQINPNP